MPHLTLTRVLLAVLVLGLALAGLWPLVRPRTTPGTFYASPSGTGSTCTQSAPCTIATWTQNAQLAQPGATLLLLDGVYRRSQGGSIAPPQGRSGTASQPITVKALNDGRVTLDAEHSGAALYLQPGNDYWHIEGLNAINGKERIYLFGGSHNRGRRLLGWTGTSGQANSYVFELGRQVDNVVSDSAGWGPNIRKVFDGAQSQAPNQESGWSGFVRCWGEWNDHPQGESNPNNTYQLGYRTRQQRFENIIGTWNTTGQSANAEGILSYFYDCEQSSNVTNSQVLGSLFYLRNGAHFAPSSLVNSFCVSRTTFKDVAAVASSEHTGKKPFQFLKQTAAYPPHDNVCDNCLSVHAGTRSVNQDGAGWTLVNFREGQGVAEATGGGSPFHLLPGLCRRYEGGVLTDQPLWPWPMESRIRDARQASGYGPTSVQGEVEAALGKIPEECLTGTAPIPPDPPTPGVGALTCTGDIAQVPGPIALQCIPDTTARRR